MNKYIATGAAILFTIGAFFYAGTVFVSANPTPVDASVFCGTVSPTPAYCLGLPDGVTTLTDGTQPLTVTDTGYNSATDLLQTSTGSLSFQGSLYNVQ